MVHNYIPILRWKQGERRGLAQLQATTKADITPLLQLAPDQFRPPRGRAAASLSPAQAFAREVDADWGATPFYLDASRLQPSAGAPHHPLVDIANACRAAGLQLIPSTTLAASTAYAAAVQAVAAIDGRGVALRVDLPEMTSAASWVAAWPIPLGDTDLIADFAGSVGTVAALGASGVAAFASLHQGASWRTVTIAGTSMPLDFSGYAAGTHLIRRAEWALWNALNGASLPYRLDYGDYATVSLAMPPPNIAWGYPINVKYTLPDEFLICRGVRTTGRGSVAMPTQLLQHARTITSYPSRAIIPTCWADDLIDDIAAGRASPGALELWVRIGVNRHIERVRLDLP